MANKKKKVNKIERMIEPSRTILYTIRAARESKDRTDIIKYSVYLPVPLFQELDRDADVLGKSVNQHIIYILQLAYGHVKHEQFPRWAQVEGMFDEDNDDFDGFKFTG